MEGSVYFNKKKSSNTETHQEFEHRRKLIEHSEKQYDKLLITLSTGGITLILGIDNKIISVIEIAHANILLGALLFFVASLLTVLLSHRTAITAGIKESENWNKATDCLNWLGFAFTVMGIILFAFGLSHFHGVK
jgi:ABC-type dipeptide/oligopeptide/nickel transport system permease component